MANCSGCVEATPITERICVSDWQTLTLDTATADIDSGKPLATNVVTLDTFFYSAGGVTELLEIELEETATTFSTPASRINIYTGNSAPAAPVANTVYAVTTDLQKILYLSGTDATGAKVHNEWLSVGTSIRRLQFDAETLRIYAGNNQNKVHFVILCGEDNHTFSGKGASMRFRCTYRLVS